MRKSILLIIGICFSISAFAQTIPYVPISQINFVSQSNLLACNDTSAYLGDTVITRGIVVTDGNLTEVPSSSVQGGVRPFIHIVDTIGNGSPGSFKGIEVMGVYTNSSGQLVVPPTFTQVVAGDIVEIKGIVDEYNSGNQISLLDANSFSVVGSTTAPVFETIPVSDLNDANRINNLATGQQWEGIFAELEDVTVSEVIFFGGNRVSFNVVDNNGNKINVSDRYLAQKLPSYQTVNPNSPQTTGSFVPPVPGTFFNSLKGIIRHDINGCSGSTGRGFEINPFDSLHYDIGFAPPYISEVERDPAIPTSTQTVDVEFKATDFDGSVDSVFFYWSDDSSKVPSQFTGTALSPVSGSTDEFIYSIPNKPNDSFVRYYIRTVDNEGNTSYYPSTPVSQAEPNVDYYFVRDNGLKIFDIQFTLDPTGNSPLVGETVTVKGIVTASTKLWDLGYLYIQDEGGAEWSGIWVVGSNDISNFYRDEEVMVTGDVQENFGMTRLSAISVTGTGKKGVVTPSSLNPNDSAGYASGEWEKWESVLMKMEDPGNKIYVSQENLGFGDYAISNMSGADIQHSTRVLAGRQSGSSQSSLYVQLVSDTVYNSLDGQMNVPAIAVADTMNMDALLGVMFYSFSNYRVLPRNNDDFININVTLDSTNLPSSQISVVEIDKSTFKIYPNPANDIVKIESNDNNVFDVLIYDMFGRIVISKGSNIQNTRLDVSKIQPGTYIMNIIIDNGQIKSTKLIIQ